MLTWFQVGMMAYEIGPCESFSGNVGLYAMQEYILGFDTAEMMEHMPSIYWAVEYSHILHNKKRMFR